MTTTVPQILEVWASQGGVYAGVMPATGDQPAYHMVIGRALPGASWGKIDDDVPAGSPNDGFANTEAIKARHADWHKAVEAVTAYTADGHTDFHLPAIEELRQIHANIGDTMGGWYWSSTQANLHEAFFFGLTDGLVHQTSKEYQWPVIPIRKVPID